MPKQAEARKSTEKGARQCPKGTVLYREGEQGDNMYVIKSGRVRLTKRVQETTVVLEELGAGAFCGELAMVNDQARPATATVIQDATVIQIASSQFENMLRSNADIAVRMMKKMTERLTRAQYRITNFSLRKNKARLMHQLRQEVRKKSSDGSMHASAPIPDNIAQALGIELGELKKLLTELTRDELITIDERGRFQIVDLQAFDRFLQYLELHDRFEYDGQT